MSPTKLCRLCLIDCHEGKSLYDEDGRQTELYKIIFTYFHPEILNMYEAKHLSDICWQCWRHICDFHSFQTQIQVAQLKLMVEDKVVVDETTKELESMAGECLRRSGASFEEIADDHLLSIKDEEEEFISEPVPEEDRIAAGSDSRGNGGDPCSKDRTSEPLDLWPQESEEPSVLVIADDATTAADNEVNSPGKLFEKLEGKSLDLDSIAAGNDSQDNGGDSCSKDRTLWTREYTEPTVLVIADDATTAADKEGISSGKLFEKLEAKSLDFNSIAAGSDSQGNGGDPCSKNRTLWAQGSYEPTAADNEVNSPDHLSEKYEPKSVGYVPPAEQDPSDFSSEDDMPLSRFVDRSKVTLLESNVSKISANKIETQSLDDLVAAWIPNIKCVVCSETSAKYSQYRQHFRQQHPHQKFYITCCNAKFSIPSKIEQHIRFHNDPKVFKCRWCGGCFRDKFGLGHHISRRHPETVDRKYVCPKCGKSFTTNKGLSFHCSKSHTTLRRPKRLTLADGSTVFKCRECEYASHSFHSFTHHRWYEHNRNPSFKCAICGSRFLLASLLRKHMTVHTTRPAIFECKVCGMVFQSYKYFVRHKRVKHNEREDAAKPITSNRKNQLQAEKQELDMLVATWLPHIECAVCSQPYPCLSLLQDHFRQHHAQERFYISCCGRKLSSLVLIKDHFQHHSDPDAFKCQLCGKCHNFSHNLKLHMKREHTQTCPECPQSFRSKAALRLHYIAVHEGIIQASTSHQTYYACNECGRICKTLPALRCHKRYHRITHRYKCSICAKAFMFSGSLRVHLTKHRLIDKLKCGFCGKRLKSPQTFDKHVASHKRDGIYACPDCPKSFTHLAYFNQHQQLVHSPTSEGEETNEVNNISQEPEIEVDNTTPAEKSCATHEKDNAYSCSFCLMSFSQRNNFDEHCKLAHPAKIDETVSNKVADLSQIPSKHIATPHGSYSQRNNFDEHCKVTHPAEIEDRQTYKSVPDKVTDLSQIPSQHTAATLHGADGIHKCPVCAKTFITRSYLDRHCQTAHPSFKKRSKRVDTSKTKNIYECPSCPMGFINRSNFELHCKIAHPQAGDTNTNPE